jgi:hypothetical protein
MFVAPAGVIKKSTSIGRVEELLDRIPSLNEAPTTLTVPILYKSLAEHPDSSIHILASEWGEFVQKTGPAIYEVLTSLFDGRKKATDETLQRGKILAEKPCVNLLGATTPEWANENFSQNLLGGGFGSRVVWINENKPKEYRLMYRKKLLSLNRNFDQLERFLLEDLQHIAENINGEFKFTEEAEDYLEEWYQKNAEAPAGWTRKLSGYHQRVPAYVMKVAMLWHLAYSDDLILNLQDIEFAISQINRIATKVQNTFKSVGTNKFIAVAEDMMKFVADKKAIRLPHLKKHFEAEAEPNKLEELISGLFQTNQLKMVVIGKEIWVTLYETTEETVLSMINI